MKEEKPLDPKQEIRPDMNAQEVGERNREEQALHGLDRLRLCHDGTSYG